MTEQDPSVQANLRKFLARRHPDYLKTLVHWLFCEDTYEGGRDWFNHNIFRYHKEGEQEFKDRKDRAYRFNHTREVVDLIQKYIFKSPPSRMKDGVPPAVAAFWANSTLSGLSIKEYMMLISTLASIFGRVWVFVDSTKTADLTTVADVKAAKVRTYSYVVKPQNILDIGFAEDGSLNWILVQEFTRDDKDPITSTGAIDPRFRLWTKTNWQLYKITDAQGKPVLNLPQVAIDKNGRPVDAQNKQASTDEIRVVLDSEGVNALGIVPCFPVDNVIGDNKYSAPALIADIVYLDRAVGNYLSNLDAIIQDQTFSQLAMPAQNTLPGESAYDSLLAMGTKRVFLYDGEGGGQPFYLTPDVKQAELIMTAINKIISEIYATVGAGAERSSKDNSVGTDNSSGVAKAYDFERLNSLLTTKSQALENAENALICLVQAYDGIADYTIDPSNPLVRYADTFDVRSLFDEFTVADRLMMIQAPKTVRREQMKQVIDKLFPALAKDLRTAMLADLETWPITQIEAQQIIATTTGSPNQGFPSKSQTTVTPGATPAATPASKNPATKNRQGQVTSETK